MSLAPRIADAVGPPAGGLDPALLRIIQSMARADAQRDFRAAQAALLPSAPSKGHG